MQNLLPKSSQFSLIDLEGSAAIDFAQRMFTRDYRGLKVGDGRLSLFLASDGKVQNLFWVFLESFGIRIFVHSTQQESLYQLVERYHFADAFTTQKKAAIHTTWEPANNPSVVGLGIKQDLFYEGFWRSTKFIFSVSPPNDSMSEENESKWNAHCEQNQIPPFSEYSQQLVFKAKLEDLCDAGKGCYIGQEVVERVRTRDLRKG